MFQEDESWNWERSEDEVKLDVFDWGDSDCEDEEHVFSDSDEDEKGAEVSPDESPVQTNLNGDSDGNSSFSSPSHQRVRKPPRWMQDYESGEVCQKRKICRTWLYSFHKKIQPCMKRLQRVRSRRGQWIWRSKLL